MNITTPSSEVITAAHPDFLAWAALGYIVVSATQLVPGTGASTWATTQAKVSIKDLVLTFAAPKV